VHEERPPAITCERFAGSGTRTLTDAGRVAIRALFERSFGLPGAPCVFHGRSRSPP
jgi:hypothetical protein